MQTLASEHAARRARLGCPSARFPVVKFRFADVSTSPVPLGPPCFIIYDRPAGPPNLRTSFERATFTAAGIENRYGFDLIDLRSARRDDELCEARFEAIYLVKKSTIWSYPQIGGFFNRDHTSAMNAVRRYEAALHDGKYIRVQNVVIKSGKSLLKSNFAGKIANRRSATNTYDGSNHP